MTNNNLKKKSSRILKNMRGEEDLRMGWEENRKEIKHVIIFN